MTRSFRIQPWSLVIGFGLVAIVLVSMSQIPAHRVQVVNPRCSCCPFDVKSYGAKGNGIKDDTQAIQAAANAAGMAENSTLCFPAGAGYLTTATITIPKEVSVKMDAPILFQGDNATAALVIGEQEEPNLRVDLTLNVKKAAISDWQDEASIGIVLHNANTSRITIVRVDGFTIGLQCLASGALFGYNRVELGLIVNNKIGVDLTNRTVTGIGACNENLFLNGRFSVFSGVNSGLSRYGVRITSQDQTYTTNNNNNFIKPSFELGVSFASPGEAIPVLVEYGALNRFELCRDEANSPTFARVLNNSTSNEFDLGRGGPTVDDQSSAPTSRLTRRDARLREESGNVLFVSGPLHLRASPYDATQTHVPGVHVANSTNADISVALTNITVTPTHLVVPGSRGLGVLLDTSELKRFVVRKDVETGFGGRVSVRSYDVNGLVLPEPGVGMPPLVDSYECCDPYFSANYGGVYVQGADNETDWYFTVTDEVKRVAVIISGGTSGCHLRGFSIHSVDGHQASVWAGYEEVIPGANLALQAPTTGTWVLGRVVYSANPQAGGSIGWVCVLGGTPGTWKSFGTIAN